VSREKNTGGLRNLLAFKGKEKAKKDLSKKGEQKSKLREEAVETS